MAVAHSPHASKRTLTPWLEMGRSDSINGWWHSNRFRSGAVRPRRNVLLVVACASLFVLVLLLRGSHVASVFESDPSVAYRRNKGVNAEYRTKAFRNTHVWIRMHHFRPERLVMSTMYAPYFAGTTVSMLDLTPSKTHGVPLFDGWKDSDTTYLPLAGLMRSLLQNTNATGLFHMHFDFWVVPNEFTSMDQSVPWMVYTTEDNELETMTVEEAPLVRPRWWYYDEVGNNHLLAEKAQAEIRRRWPQKYKFVDDCIGAGWSDLFYIPRSYFEDFIQLAEVFFKHNVHHETAIPSILLILLGTYHSERVNWAQNRCPQFSEFAGSGHIALIDDCWGTCCLKYKASRRNIALHRCGHALDLRDAGAIEAALSRI